MKDTKRVQYIDIAKGIAMLAIIVGHMGISEVNRIVFTFHVPVFYLITGYFVKDEDSVKEFVIKKARTLLIPYYVTCVAIILSAVGINELLLEGEGTKLLIRNWIKASLYAAGDTYTEPFAIPGIGAIWFLWACFWGSCFLRVILNMKNRIFRCTAVLLIFAFGYYTREWFWFPLSIQAGCTALLFMYLGYQIRGWIPYFKKMPLWGKYAFAFLSVCMWGYFMITFQSFWLVHCDMGRGLIDWIGCICGCYIIMLISRGIEKYMKKTAAVLSYLGSFSLFMLSAHIVELNTFPWYLVWDKLSACGVSVWGIRGVVLAGKLLWILSVTILCSVLKAKVRRK